MNNQDQTNRKKGRDVIDNLFESLDVKSKGLIIREDILEALRSKGILEDDIRIKETVENLKAYETKRISPQDFRKIISQNVIVIERALTGGLIIPDFKNFSSFITNIYNKTLLNKKGDVSDHTPILEKVKPEQYAISICTVDGQRFNIGDSNEAVLVQGISKAINYCMILEDLKEEEVRKHIGREQEAQTLNGLFLNKEGLPHNALDDAGALVGVSLIDSKKDIDSRYSHITDIWKSLSGKANINFNKPAYLAEKEAANNYSAIAYFMQEKKLFPEGSNFKEHLDLFLRCLSIDTNTESLSVVAATLASAGICPLTGESVFKSITVRNCLSTMYFCGMGKESGDFSFTVGMPSISGKSGLIMIVIPNVMGIAIWSPKINIFENSMKGMDFCYRLVQQFNFHGYDSTIRNLEGREDPRLMKNEEKMEGIMAACDAAAKGDLNELKRLVANEVDLNDSDYDLRTPMHLAAAEGHEEVIRYFISLKLDISPKDRWGGTPIRDAENGKHERIINLLRSNGAR